MTEDAAPEYGTTDTTIYSVCSDFVYKVYYEALGHRLLGAENYLGATTSDFWLKSEDVALIRWIQAVYEMDEMDAKWPNSEEFVLMNVQYLATMNKGREIHEFINEIISKGQIYLSTKTNTKI